MLILLAGDKQFSEGDGELASLATNGNQKAFECLINRHKQRILSICLRMLNNRVEAEESAQDCFVKIYFHLKDFDSSRDFAIWASSIAINECRDRLRKRSRFNRSFRELDETIAAPADVNNGTIDKNKLEIVEKALEKLPAKLREILVLKAYGEHSYDDIAQILGLRIGTVMSRLFRARRKLTDILSKGNSA